MKLEKVMLIDDDEIDNHISKIAIEKTLYSEQIIIKKNGVDALNYLEKECEITHKFPELILLDLKMPGMDGFKFLEKFEILCKKARNNIVVVVLSSSCNADDILRLRGLGNYYLVNKPLTPEKIIDISHRYFRGRSNSLVPVK